MSHNQKQSNMKREIEEHVIELSEGGCCTVEYCAEWREGNEDCGIPDGWVIKIQSVYVNICGRIHPDNQEDIIFLYSASYDVDGIDVTDKSKVDLALIEEIIYNEVLINK